MGKFTRGFVLGALAAGAWTLFNVKQDGATTRRQLKSYVNDFCQDSQQLGQDTCRIRHALHEVTDKGLPLLQSTVGEVQTLFRRFQESNGPRIRRTQEKVEKLNSDLEEVQENVKNS